MKKEKMKMTKEVCPETNGMTKMTKNLRIRIRAQKNISDLNC